MWLCECGIGECMYVGCGVLLVVPCDVCGQVGCVLWWLWCVVCWLGVVWCGVCALDVQQWLCVFMCVFAGVVVRSWCV